MRNAWVNAKANISLAKKPATPHHLSGHELDIVAADPLQSDQSMCEIFCCVFSVLEHPHGTEHVKHFGLASF